MGARNISKKRAWVREIFQKKGHGCEKYFKKKEQKREFTRIYCRRYVSVIENDISGNLSNELFRKNGEEKLAVFLNMAWSLIVHKNTIKICSTILKEFWSWSLSLYIFYFLFIKARILLQFLSQAFTILYMFSPFSFVFINALITST